jgi:hypothetical protein
MNDFFKPAIKLNLIIYIQSLDKYFANKKGLFKRAILGLMR